MASVRQAAMEGAEARADAVACYDNKRGHDAYNDAHNDAHNDAYNDACYDMHVNNDGVRVDEVRRAAMGDGAVRADVVVVVRMHISLPADK
jgi:hypothetical protein